ncbi:MAG: 6-bladed beta-propeller, partial [Nitrosotalea sp.]
GNNRIVEFYNNDTFIKSFGSLESLLLSLPSNVALGSNGDIFVADQGNDRILVFDNAGNFLFSFGSQGTGNGEFKAPFGIAFDSSDDIYVVDTGNNRVEKFSNTGSFLSTFGTEGAGNGQLQQPLGIAIDSVGDIYVADTNNQRISEFSSSGTFIQSFGTGTLSKPSGVVFNAAGNFYVSDRVKNNVYEFNSITGSLINTFPNTNSSGITFNIPYGIGFDFPGNLHIADSGNDRVVVLSSTGQLVTQFGFLGSGNGQFNTPSGLAIDASGNIYVADTGNNRVEIFSPTIIPRLTTITLNSPSTPSVRWGLDSVSISGHATGISSGDNVTVNWGDGSTTSGILVSAFTGTWGPVTHIYQAVTSGQTEQIVGTIVNNGNTVATSLPVSVSVIAHHTSLAIGNILNVPFGGLITASGVLTDTDANSGISGMPITFSGTGVGVLSPKTTTSGGSYSSTGTTINSISSGLQVTANFAGNSQYLLSSATTSSTFSTLQHHVALYLKPIPNSPWSSTITISGTLNDTDGGNVGVNGEPITIIGSGITSSQVITTSTISGKAGSFSTTASTTNNVANGLSVTATFTGDSNYIGNSASISFSTIVHRTSLTLNPIPNVAAGVAITASGILTDTDSNVGLVGSTITFNGTGLDSLSSTSSGPGGSYSSNGNAPNDILSGLALQAHFSGSLLYQNADSIIQTYSTGNPPSVSINAPVISNTLGNNQARWGIDTVSINGTASNAAIGDTITVTWGDSTSVNNIPINSGKWSTLNHIYGSGAIGTNPIIATLVSSGNIDKTSSAPLSISVLQHRSVLTLNTISNVGVGGIITATGTLTDADTNIGIASQSITFTGTGVGTLTSASTSSSGAYAVTGTALTSAATGLTLQAHFGGELDTLPSSSIIQTYNVLPTPPFRLIDSYVIFGLDGVHLEQNTTVASGNVGEQTEGSQIHMEQSSQVFSGSLAGDILHIEKNTVVNDVYYNQLHNDGTITGTKNTPLTLPVLASLPAFPTFSVGSKNINVNSKSSLILQPGSYNDISVKDSATLEFVGGTYNINSLSVGKDSKLLFDDKSQIQVNGAIDGSQGDTVAPSSSNIDATGILFFARSHIHFGQSCIIYANMYAPNAEIHFEQNTVATGAFIGDTVHVEKNSKINLDSDFANVPTIQVTITDHKPGDNLPGPKPGDNFGP